MIIGIEAQRLFRRKKHGMEIVALEIIRQLQQLDHTNEYTLFAKKDADESCIELTPNFSIEYTSSAPYPMWEQFHLPRAVKKLKPALLHCTANTAPLFCKTPLVLTLHDVIFLESISFSGSAYQNFGNLYRRFIVPRAAKKAALIITVSEYEKKVIAKTLSIPQEKIRVIYNGANAQFKLIEDSNVLDEFRRKYDLPAKYLLHFGNTAPKKNTIGVLHAYKLYTQATTKPLPLVITDCSASHIKQLLTQLNATALMEHIKILDYVPFSSIPCLYNLASLFLYPSHRESFGMPVIEAMACGVPVLTSNSSALPEIAGGAAILVDPKDPGEISEQILRLLSDEQLYKDRQDMGFMNATRFSWQNAAVKLLSVYNEIKHTT